jgi:hypothetical protein
MELIGVRIAAYLVFIMFQNGLIHDGPFYLTNKDSFRMPQNSVSTAVLNASNKYKKSLKIKQSQNKN